MTCQAVCPVGFYGLGTGSTGRTCRPCAASCAACHSQGFCTRCSNGTYLTADFTCAVGCPEGFYGRNPLDGSLEGRTCQSCVGDCLTCESRFSCTRCGSEDGSLS